VQKTGQNDLKYSKISRHHVKPGKGKDWLGFFVRFGRIFSSPDVSFVGPADGFQFPFFAGGIAYLTPQ